MLHSDEQWILRCYDALQGCGFDYISIFGVPYIELPLEVAEDIRALKHRDAQVNAKKS